MQPTTKQIISTSALYSVLISLFAHGLLLASFSFHWWQAALDVEKRPDLLIPSYVAQPSKIVTSSTKNDSSEITANRQPTSSQGLEKLALSNAKKIAEKKKASASTQAFKPMQSLKEEQGVHLIGDEKIDKSLRVILGKAISQHLIYPKSAIDFHVHGTVLVGFILHPDGHVTNIRLVKPSSAGILNGAALSAIKEISPVSGIAEYLSTSRFLVVGIIFE